MMNMMNEFAQHQFAQFEQTEPLVRKPRSRRRSAARAAMQFAIDNRDRFQSAEELRKATEAYLRSGQQFQDDEYGSFVLSFIIGPIISWIVGRMIQWVWDRRHELSAQPET